MKVLFICLDHYPQNGACASLLNKMLFDGGLKERLGEVHILSVKAESTESDCECINGITVHRCLPPILLTKEDIFYLLLRDPSLALRGIAAKLANRISILLRKQGPIFKKNVVAKLVEKVHQLESEEYDVVIPICGQYEGAVAALKSEWPVVLYQVDPFSTNMRFDGNCPKKALMFEKRLHRKARAIITTPIIYREILRDYPQEIAQKTYAMEFPNVSVATVTTTMQKREKITCLFAGSIYPAARNPRYTVNLFERMQDSRIQLNFLGATEKFVCKFLGVQQIGENISFLGSLPLERAREKIAEADFLVNIGNIMTNQVPSKIFEYISSGKPIINVCVNADCPSIPYLEKYPLALSIVEGVGTPEEHSAEIEKFIIDNAGKTVDKAIILERFKECTAEYCAEKMAGVLKSLKPNDSAVAN